MQYRNGSFLTTGTPTALNITLGFVPDHFVMTNMTHPATSGDIARSEFYAPMAAASAILFTGASGVVWDVSTISTNGYTIFDNGADYTATQFTITGVSKANPGVVTLSSATGLIAGSIGTISSVVGMTQLNTNRYIVGSISGATFTLYDLFGNPVNTNAFGTYTSGGIFNVISQPATAPVLNALTGQVITPGSPSGLQYDIGSAGITLGTGLFNSLAETWFWEAFYSTPTGW